MVLYSQLESLLSSISYLGLTKRCQTGISKIANYNSSLIGSVSQTCPPQRPPSRNPNLGFPTTCELTILRLVLLPTSFSYPKVGALLNRITKSFESMCEPRLEWSRDPALETTAQELYLACLVLSGISPRYGHQSPHLFYLIKTSNPHKWRG